MVLVTRMGEASGARAAAAALACAASEPDRAALLVDLGGDRPPRSTPIATKGARGLEERLAAHLPEAAVASRGAICQLSLPGDAEGLGRAPAALPLARGSAAVLHLPPGQLQPAVAAPRIEATGVLLVADLMRDRSLVALVVRDLLERGLRTVVLKHPLPWLAARAARLGALPHGAGLPARCITRLLPGESSR